MLQGSSAISSNYRSNVLLICAIYRRDIGKILEEQSVIFDDYRYHFFCTIRNCDYKIASKAIANRVKTVLPKLISEDQTGFIKGRNIGENICIIDSIINYTGKKNIPGLLLFLNFKNAFDTLEWSFIIKTFQYFGFGPSLSSWIKLFLPQYRKLYLEQWMDKQFLST